MPVLPICKILVIYNFIYEAFNKALLINEEQTNNRTPHIKETNNNTNPITRGNKDKLMESTSTRTQEELQ